jgi:hypothetical protein
MLYARSGPPDDDPVCDCSQSVPLEDDFPHFVVDHLPAFMCDIIQWSCAPTGLRSGPLEELPICV